MDGAIEWVNQQDGNSLYLSVITLGEIRKGVNGMLDVSRRNKISHWLEYELPNYFDGRMLTIDAQVADRWGIFQCHVKGHVIPALDCFIAAIASVHNLKLVTHNTKDFHRLPVELVNPWE